MAAEIMKAMAYRNLLFNPDERHPKRLFAATTASIIKTGSGTPILMVGVVTKVDLRAQAPQYKVGDVVCYPLNRPRTRMPTKGDRILVNGIVNKHVDASLDGCIWRAIDSYSDDSVERMAETTLAKRKVTSVRLSTLE